MKRVLLLAVCALLIGCGEAPEKVGEAKAALDFYTCPPYSPSNLIQASPMWGPAPYFGGYEQLYVLATGRENNNYPDPGDSIQAVVQQYRLDSGYLDSTCYDVTPPQWKTLYGGGSLPSELYFFHKSIYTIGNPSVIFLEVQRYQLCQTAPGGFYTRCDTPQSYWTYDGGFTWSGPYGGWPY